MFAPIICAKLFKTVSLLVLSSIPEETFLVIFTLILLKQYNLLVPGLTNVRKLFIPVISAAIISNLLRFLELDISIVFFLSSFSLMVLLILFLRAKSFKEAAKITMCVTLSLITLQLIEFSYIPLTLYITNRPLSFFHDDILLTLLMTLPERAMEYSLLTYLLLKKFSFLKVDVIKTVLDSRILSTVTSILLLLNVSLLFVVGYYLNFRKSELLTHLPFSVQLALIILTLLFPVVNLTGLWVIIYNMESKHLFDIRFRMGEVMALNSIAKKYCSQGRYDEAFAIMEKIGKKAKEV